MNQALIIFLGSGLGGLARWALGSLIAQRYGAIFPWDTLLVNVSGSFLIGIFATFSGPDARILAPVALREFFMVGLCGGYTTFSSFSLQTLALAQDGHWVRAAFNAGMSVVLCMLAVWLGHVLGLMVNLSKGS